MYYVRHGGGFCLPGDEGHKYLAQKARIDKKKDHFKLSLILYVFSLLMMPSALFFMSSTRSAPK